jgi:mono/diheme cytochrome c family protein
MNDEQLDIIGAVIDPQHWARKFKTMPADVELVKAVLKEAKIL